VAFDKLIRGESRAEPDDSLRKKLNGPAASLQSCKKCVELQMTVVLWILAVALILVGVAGTVLPVLPGAILVFAGILLAAWIDDFTRIPVWLVVILGAFTAIAWAVDYLAAVAGAKKAGASKLALIGAAIGTVAGIVTGLWGLLFMPLVGAAVGGFVAQRDFLRAGKVGVATWIGLLIGTAVKVAIVFAMVGVFVVALIFGR